MIKGISCITGKSCGLYGVMCPRLKRGFIIDPWICHSTIARICRCSSCRLTGGAGKGSVKGWVRDWGQMEVWRDFIMTMSMAC